MAKLQSVPDEKHGKKGANRHRVTTTSFRIPIPMFDQVKDEATRRGISISQVYLTALVEFFDTFTEGSWETEDDPNIYDSARFYTKSSDQKGHSVTIHVPIPKPLAGEISNLTQSGAVPAYRSIGDVVRDSLAHRLHDVSKRIDNGELETTVSMTMLMSDELQIIDEAQQAEHLIDAIRSNAQAIWNKDDGTKRLRLYLASRKEMADSIPEQYRQDYLDAIEEYEKRIQKADGKRAKRKK